MSTYRAVRNWLREADGGASVALVVGMLVTFVGTFLFRWLTISAFDNDHFDHVVRAHQLLLGELPGRDFIDPGMPLTYLISAAVHSVVGMPFLAEALTFVPALALAAALNVRLATLASGSVPLALGAVLLQVAMYPRSYGYPKILVYAVAMTVGWWAIERLTTRRLAALAAATAFAYYLRHDHGVYVATGSLALLVVHLRAQGIRHLTRTLAQYGLLVFAFVLPHLVYVQWSEGIGHYLRVARDFSVEEARQMRLGLPAFRIDTEQRLWGPEPVQFNIRWTPGLGELERREIEDRHGLRAVWNDGVATWRYEISDVSAENLATLRRDVHVEDTHDFELLSRGNRWRAALRGWLRPGPGMRPTENAAPLLFWFCWLARVAGVALLARARTPVPGGLADERAAMAMVVALALCVNIGFLRLPLVARLPDVTTPHVVLGAWLLAAAWRWPASRLSRVAGRAALAAGAGVILFAVVFAFEPGEKLEQSRLLAGPGATAERWRQVTTSLQQDLAGPLPNGPSEALVPFLRYVRRCTAPDDRLMYLGYGPEVYVLARRGFAGGHMMFIWGFHSSHEEQALTLRRLQRQQVPFVIAPPEAAGHMARVFADVWREIEPRYRPMTSIEWNNGEIDILVDPSRTPSGVDAETGWPCFVSQG